MRIHLSILSAGLAVCLLIPQLAEARERENWFLFGQNSPLMRSESVQGQPRQAAGMQSQSTTRQMTQTRPQQHHERGHRGQQSASYQANPQRQAAPSRPPVPERFNRQEVAYPTSEPRGTIVIDTEQKFLYLVLGNGRAMRYGIGWARPGFKWQGTHRVSRKAEWPDWRPPAAMRQREPHLPAFMPGGPGNPLGARALYLGSSLYRIHGTAEPWTIGQNVSSGCIRLRNEDVIDLYERVSVGARVIVR